MNEVGWRYVALIVVAMYGGMILLGVLFTPIVGAVYALVFGLSYQQHPWLHRTLARMSNGKGKRP